MIFKLCMESSKQENRAWKSVGNTPQGQTTRSLKCYHLITPTHADNLLKQAHPCALHVFNSSYNGNK